MDASSTAIFGLLGYLAVYPLLEAQPQAAPDITSIIHQIQQGVVSAGETLLQAVNDTVLSLTRVAFVTLLILGFFLYFTHLHKRLGRDLLFGGVVLAIISQFVIPFIGKA